MPLNDVTFNVLSGGLGRQESGDDHVSALVFDTIAPPSALGSLKLKAYVDIDQVKADGITSASATYSIVYYHASEFFRLAPGRTLWLCFSGITYPTSLFTASGGKIRQIGVFFSDFATLTSVQQAAADALAALHAPVFILAGYYHTAALTLSTATDLGTLTCPNVEVLLAGDGAGKGYALATTLTRPYIPAVGAVLGAWAKAKVHESAAWVEKFNLSDGAELDVIRLADGNNSPSNSTLSQLDDKRYVLLRKHIGITGTYLTDTHTAVAETNDLAYGESVRTIGKARRLLRTAFLPNLNAPLTVDDDGKLEVGTVKYFEQVAISALNQMRTAGELSDFGVYINPAQNVLSTGILTVQVKLVPRGVARNIVVNIGFAINTTF